LSGFEGGWEGGRDIFAYSNSPFEPQEPGSNQRITSQNVVTALKQQKMLSKEGIMKLRQELRFQSQPAEVLSSCGHEEPPSL